jgi:hypothetical protein
MLNYRAMSRTNSDLVRAFPATLRVDALRVISVLPEASLTAYQFSVEIGQDTVWIPYRIYHDPAVIDAACLTRTQSERLACLLTRHHNGFVREEYLSRIVDCNHEWVPPFIVQLAGEYVIEIIRLIRDSIPRLDHEIYRAFLTKNPTFFGTTKERVQSYWDCYHRGERRGDYAGFEVLEFLDSLTVKSRV